MNLPSHYLKIDIESKMFRFALTAECHVSETFLATKRRICDPEPLRPSLSSRSSVLARFEEWVEEWAAWLTEEGM